MEENKDPQTRKEPVHRHEGGSTLLFARHCPRGVSVCFTEIPMVTAMQLTSPLLDDIVMKEIG